MMNKKYILSFLVLLATYIILAFGLPTDPQTLARYELTQSSARLINITIVLPLIAIYLTALYGFMRFNGYAKSVKDSKEGPHLQTIAKGLMIFVFSLPVMAILGSLRTFIRYKHPDFAIEASALRNYLALIFALITFYLIAKGVEGLVNTIKKKNNAFNPFAFFGVIAPIALTSLYTWLITTEQSSPSFAENPNLPDWVMIVTLVIPFTFAWTMGMRSATQLYTYQHLVKGKIYKEALKNISWGLGVLIVTAILIQFISSSAERLNRLDLTPLVIFIYFLLVLYAVGFGLIARGSKSLKKIEEV